MTRHSSTLPGSIEPTVVDASITSDHMILLEQITAEWARVGKADLVAAMKQHPRLLHDRSLLLNLALQEYRTRKQTTPCEDLKKHCERFSGFGSSVERSIFRQLETQQYLDEHPELLAFVTDPRWPAAGEQFGTFFILEELGRGASARVYRCCQSDIGNREVVLKVSPFTDFEASVLGRLNHPNIIPILSVGMVDEFGLNYLCMPFSGRSTLNDLLDLAFQSGVPRSRRILAEAASRWLPPEGPKAESKSRGLLDNLNLGTYVDAVIDIAAQLADALDHAHRQGILHGDLKPSNVLLTPDGQPLILDFNLSRDSSSALPLGGGTLPYMPPEYLQLVARDCADSDTAAYSVKTDVYSFGALLYELLAGHTPARLSGYFEDTAQIAEALLVQLRTCKASVRNHTPLVGKTLDVLVSRCLAIAPEDRPASMSEVKLALKRERRLTPVLGRQARARPLATAIVVAGLLAMTGAATTYVATRPPAFMTRYDSGERYFQEGQFVKAAEQFEASIASNNSFLPAHLQLGRSRIASGELELAIDAFTEPATNRQDPHCMAYIGYCFNRKGIPSAAIVWHEKALSQGAESVALMNNLGASYLIAGAGLSKDQQIAVAEKHLTRAFELDKQSCTVRLNLVRLEMAKAERNPAHELTKALPHVRYLATRVGNDPVVRLIVVGWYTMLEGQETPLAITPGMSAKSTTDLENLVNEKWLRLSSVLPHMTDEPLTTTMTGPIEFDIANLATSAAPYYIEPASLSLSD